MCFVIAHPESQFNCRQGPWRAISCPEMIGGGGGSPLVSSAIHGQNFYGLFWTTEYSTVKHTRTPFDERSGR